MRMYLLVVCFFFFKWLLILSVVMLLKIYVNELNKIGLISSQFDMDTQA